MPTKLKNSPDEKQNISDHAHKNGQSKMTLLATLLHERQVQRVESCILADACLSGKAKEPTLPDDMANRLLVPVKAGQESNR